MAFKDTLLTFTTYPDPTPAAVIDDALGVAEALGSQLSAIACAVERRAPGGFLADMVINFPAMAAAEFKKSRLSADDLLAAFKADAQRRGIFQDAIVKECGPAEVLDVLTAAARLRDLTLVPVPVGDMIDQWFAEAIIFGSGRPTMILPHERKRRGAVSLDVAIVAWDFSRAAARAVADAMPMLARAKRVHVLTVSNEKALDPERSGSELATYLGRHGIETVVDHVDAAGRKIGAVLEAQIEKAQADVLVMGAFGHSRLREFVLGGATRTMLMTPPVPVFLSH